MLVVAIVLYVALAAVYATVSADRLGVPVGDGLAYETTARQLLTDHFYGYKSTQPNAWIAPGYPFFLAAVYGVTGTADTGTERPWVVLLVLQMLMGIGTLLLTYTLGRDVFDERAGAIGALAFAVYPPMFMIPGLWLTEPLATVIVLGYIVVQLRAVERRDWKLALLAGVLLGLAARIRPATIAIAVAPFLLAAVFGPRKGIVRQAALVFLAWALVMSPWVVRNMVVLGHPLVFSSHSDDPMLAGVDPYFYEMGPAYRYHGPTGAQFYIDNPQGGGKAEYAKAAIAEDFMTKPLQTLWWFTIGKFDRLYFDEIWASRPRYIGSFAKLVHFPIVVLGMVGGLLAVRRKRLRAPALMVVFATVATLPFVPESRYVFEFMPVLAVLAGAVLLVLWTCGAEPGPVTAKASANGTTYAPHPPEEDA